MVSALQSGLWASLHRTFGMCVWDCITSFHNFTEKEHPASPPFPNDEVSSPTRRPTSAACQWQPLAFVKRPLHAITKLRVSLALSTDCSQSLCEHMSASSPVHRGGCAILPCICVFVELVHSLFCNFWIPDKNNLQPSFGSSNIHLPHYF